MNQKILMQQESGKLSVRIGLALFKVILGSILLAALSQLAIPLPFSPVPITMQTLGVALLTITLGPRLACFSVLTYLAQATIGLPVLAGGFSNPLWMIGPKAGYLIGFAVAPLLVGTLLKKQTHFSFIKTWCILSLNEISILIVGTSWLGFFVGWENTFIMGLAPFIPGALWKITIAAFSFQPIAWIKSKF